MRLKPRQLAVGGAIALASVAGFGAITAASADDGSPKVEHQTPSNDDKGSDTKTDHNCPKDRDGSNSSTSSDSNA